MRFFNGMFLLALSVLVLAPGPACHGSEVRVGTWKTAQTIQPFFYGKFLPDSVSARVFPFTNPADQKTAL
ncbi:MAG: aliphatic sulfonates ABC transporter substrate-binding protein, partial [Desulfobacterales bacterium]